MSSNSKLGKVKLNDAQKLAIAEMVETDGFKVWKKVIAPHREIQIALTVIATALDERQLWQNKGQAIENGKALKDLEEIANEYNANPDKDEE